MEFRIRHQIAGSAALMDTSDVVREELAMMDSAVRRDDFREVLACIERAEAFFASLKSLAQNVIFINSGGPASDEFRKKT